MIFVLALLTIVAWRTWAKETDVHIHDCDECCHDGCDHHNHYPKKSRLKKIITYVIFLFPFVTGVFFPVATLDSTIVKAKGFHFPMMDDDHNTYSQHQVLRPDISSFVGEDGYDKMMKKELGQFQPKQQIVLNDADFLKGLEIIYNYLGNFSGKTITMKGFAYNGDDINKNQVFLLRFGIIHCIADSGVYGMMLNFPSDVHFSNDQWIEVSGTLSSIYYQPFKTTIPYIKVTKWQQVSEPKDPYVYRPYGDLK
jgi:putative membrane protein